MASITNLERNLELDISLKVGDMSDYYLQKNKYESWVPFTLCLYLPDRHSMIREDINAEMTVFEIEHLVCGIKDVLAHLERQENYVYVYNSSESYFELKLEVISEDNVVEVEVWINVGNQTNGKIFGFDEGARFITDKVELAVFLEKFTKDLSAIKGM